MLAIFCASFVPNFVTKNFQKSPNLVTLNSLTTSSYSSLPLQFSTRNFDPKSNKMLSTNKHFITLESQRPNLTASLFHLHRLSIQSNTYTWSSIVEGDEGCIGPSGEFLCLWKIQTRLEAGGSPGLLVMGGDSCSKGRGFESQHCTYTGWTYFTFICCKNCNVCLKRQK